MLLTGAPHDRIYFGTDTNVFAPLLGCALAIGVHERRLWTPTARVGGLAAVGVIVAACIPWHYYDRRLLYATIAVALLATIAVHACLIKPALWLENRVLRWFGTISYGLYLWHYMMISLPWERLIPFPPFVGMIGAPIALAWISWRYVEAPLLGKWPVARVPQEPLLTSP